MIPLGEASRPPLSTSTQDSTPPVTFQWPLSRTKALSFTWPLPLPLVLAEVALALVAVLVTLGAGEGWGLAPVAGVFGLGMVGAVAGGQALAGLERHRRARNGGRCSCEGRSQATCPYRPCTER